MEPLSSFTVACNVLQVIEAGAKILNKAVEYHRTQDGLSKEHQDLKHVAQTLNNLNADLQATLPKAHKAGGVSSAEARLIEANNECLRLSTNFIHFLDGLRVRNPQAILDAFRASIKSLWHKDKVAAMEKAVSQARDNLNVAFLVYMKYVNDTDHLKLLTRPPWLGAAQCCNTRWRTNVYHQTQAQHSSSCTVVIRIDARRSQKPLL